MMKTQITKNVISTAIALAVAGCGGSGGGISGIGGSGFISSGSISNFGSVFVNGVEFETSGTIFDIDDSGSGSESDLAIGMVVTVNGTVNADGVTGNATSISFDDELQGPVSGITAVAADPDEENRSFTILGTTVRINAINTVFDVTGALTGTPFDFDIIANGNNVEISGFFNTAGELIATRVELKATTFSTSDIVELKGTVTGFTDISTPFTLTGLTGIDINAIAAVTDNLPIGGLTDGLLVEVKGTCNDALNCTLINATRVEGQNGFDDADKISVEGLITDFIDSSNFKLNGISVNAFNATFSPTTMTLRDGLRVEVEGPISSNAIQAITVELRGGDARVHATVSSVDSVTGNFVVTANAQTIAITVTTATEMEDAISAGNFVRLRGFENDTGGITATRVEVRSDDDVIVQGDLQDYDPGVSIQLLGVTFGVDAGGETEFEDDADAPLTELEFIAAAPVGTLVKVKDKNDSPVFGVADEIDIETP